ncbi:Spc7 kinetochore protein-domain-containing protein [Cladochytrium replicatum]|nr:Spc7 kinetochore protein-domain-containing protein [Cladochytrium replicatum]
MRNQINAVTNSETMSNTNLLSSPVQAEQTFNTLQDKYMGNTEDDLMDEHLSVVGDSLTEPENISLQDFFKLAQLEYPDLAGYLKDNSDLSLNVNGIVPNGIEIACMYLPKFQLFEYGCEELSSHVSNSLESIRLLQENLEENNPPVFFELIESVSDQNSDIHNQLRGTYRFSEESAMEAFYVWKFKLIESLLVSQQKYFEMISQDSDTLEQNLSEVQSILSTIEQEQTELCKWHAKNDNMSESDNSMQAELDALSSDLSSIQKIESDIKEAQNEISNVKVHVERLMIEKTHREQAISEATKHISELDIVDPDEMFGLSELYNNLKTVHSLQPISVGSSSSIWQYDTIVQIEIQSSGNTVVSLIDPPVTSKKGGDLIDSQLIEAFGKTNIELWLNALGSTNGVSRSDSEVT